MPWAVVLLKLVEAVLIGLVLVDVVVYALSGLAMADDSWSGRGWLMVWLVMSGVCGGVALLLVWIGSVLSVW